MEKRTSVKTLYAESENFGGKYITVMGWARTIRDGKEFGFIELNDGSCFKGVQVVFERKAERGRVAHSKGNSRAYARGKTTL